MEYSDTLKWFSKVWWAEKCKYVNCVVDAEITDMQPGYFLVEESGYLHIYSDIQIHSITNPHSILGKAQKWECDFVI